MNLVPSHRARPRGVSYTWPVTSSDLDCGIGFGADVDLVVVGGADGGMTAGVAVGATAVLVVGAVSAGALVLGTPGPDKPVSCCFQPSSNA